MKSETGKRFSYYSPAVAFMKEDPRYTEKDITRFYLYPDGINHKQQSDLSWSTSVYLPEGWACKPLKKGWAILLKSCDDTKLKSYKTAAAHMEADSRYTKEDVERLYHYPDGKSHKLQSKEEMQRSKYLPKGWMFRDRKRGLDILTSDGTKLESYIAVNRYMQFKQTFTKKQMNMIYLFPDGKNHKTGQN